MHSRKGCEVVAVVVVLVEVVEVEVVKEAAAAATRCLHEAIRRVDRHVLVVAAVEEHAVRQAELPRVQRQHHLDAARPAVDEVAVEHVERVLVGPPILREDVQQIRELAVEVADDG